MLKNATRPRKVDFDHNFADVKVKKMKQKSFTHEAIAKYTGLTVGQVNYRVKKGNLSVPLEYRRGRSKAAREVIRSLDSQLLSMGLIK